MMIINRDRLIVMVVIALSLVAIASHFSSSGGEYSRYNHQWNGTSQFFGTAERYGSISLDSIEALPEQTGAMLLIIAPREGYSDDEILAYSNFLEKGNTIFIADDGRISNKLLEKIGCNVRIVPGRLKSIDREFIHADSILGYTVRSDNMTEGVNAIVLNRPSYVTGGDALINTSILTWEEKHGNNVVDADENLTFYAIFSRATVNGGTIYVLSDPSIFINCMQPLDAEDNQRFIRNILETPQQILIDQGHCEDTRPIGLGQTTFLPGSGLLVEIIATVFSIAGIIYLFYSKIY
jgi:hypothetical protein